MNVARSELIFSTPIFAKNGGKSGKHAEGTAPSSAHPLQFLLSFGKS